MCGDLPGGTVRLIQMIAQEVEAEEAEEPVLEAEESVVGAVVE